MPDIGLPTGVSRAPKGPGSRGGRGFKKRGGGRENINHYVAHDIGGVKERTEDVGAVENREKTFSDLLLSQPVLKGLQTAGFIQPSPVQLLAIPKAKIGFDLIVQSKSGTGKTCVYVVAALEMIKPELHGLQALVLAPTREIAIQGVTVAMQIGHELGQVKMSAFIGGISLAEDKVKAKTCQLGVGTPGRLKQLITEGILSVDSVRLVVLDEADKLLEPAFLEDTTKILNMLPKSKQVLALSATYPEQLASLAERFMRSPQHIRPGQSSQVLAGVAQFVYKVQHCPAPARQNALKQAALLDILSSVPYTQVLVFSNYSTIAQATADFLNSRGFPAIFISAGQDQARRLATIRSFKQFNCRILCSTDLTARGIDAENVNLVINLEVPWDHNTYLHRIGRGGRFGSLSLAVTLASQGAELSRMRGVVKKTKGIVRILPEELPRDIRNDTDDMEVLEAAEEDLVENSFNSTDKKLNGDDDSQASGKIKRRSKRRANGDSVELGNDINNSEVTEVTPSNKKDDLTEEIEDRKIVHNFLAKEQNTEKVKLMTMEEINVITNELEMVNEEEEKVPIASREEDSRLKDKDMLEKVGQAVIRISNKRREEYMARLADAKKKVEGFEVNCLLEKLTIRDLVSEENFGAEKNNSANDHVSESPDSSKSDTDNTVDSESDSDTDSDSSNSSSSDSDSDSTSSSSDSEDSPSSQGAAANFPSYPVYPPNQSYQSHPSFQPHPSYHPYSVLPSQPPPPGHPSAQAWYTQWANTVYRERLAIQQVEYNKYLQYLAQNKCKK